MSREATKYTYQLNHEADKLRSINSRSANAVEQNAHMFKDTCSRITYGFIAKHLLSTLSTYKMGEKLKFSRSKCRSLCLSNCCTTCTAKWCSQKNSSILIFKILFHKGTLKQGPNMDTLMSHMSNTQLLQSSLNRSSVGSNCTKTKSVSGETIMTGECMKFLMRNWSGWMH